MQISFCENFVRLGTLQAHLLVAACRPLSLGGANAADPARPPIPAPILNVEVSQVAAPHLLSFRYFSCRPVFWAGRAPLTLRDCLFCSVSGLRGSIALILAQAVVTEVPAAVNSTALVGLLRDCIHISTTASLPLVLYRGAAPSMHCSFGQHGRMTCAFASSEATCSSGLRHGSD